VRAASVALAAVDRAIRRSVLAGTAAALLACRRGASGNRDPSRPRTSGGMVLWVAAMLAAYLIAYYT